MNREPPTIDHNPHERREPKWLWKAIFAFVAFFWVIHYPTGYEWTQVALGAITGLFLGLWAMEKTGGEVPSSWRVKQREESWRDMMRRKHSSGGDLPGD